MGSNSAARSMTNLLFRYNSFDRCCGIGQEGSAPSNARAVGNTLGPGAGTCIRGVTYSYNVWLGTGNDFGPCGTGDVTTATNPFVTGGNSGSTLDDLHLRCGTLAQNFVPPNTSDLPIELRHRRQPAQLERTPRRQRLNRSVLRDLTPVVAARPTSRDLRRRNPVGCAGEKRGAGAVVPAVRLGASDSRRPSGEPHATPTDPSRHVERAIPDSGGAYASYEDVGSMDAPGLPRVCAFAVARRSRLAFQRRTGPAGGRRYRRSCAGGAPQAGGHACVTTALPRFSSEPNDARGYGGWLDPARPAADRADAGAEPSRRRASVLVQGGDDGQGLVDPRLRRLARPGQAADGRHLRQLRVSTRFAPDVGIAGDAAGASSPRPETPAPPGAASRSLASGPRPRHTSRVRPDVLARGRGQRGHVPFPGSELEALREPGVEGQIQDVAAPIVEARGRAADVRDLRVCSGRTGRSSRAAAG